MPKPTAASPATSRPWPTAVTIPSSPSSWPFPVSCTLKRASSYEETCFQAKRVRWLDQTSGPMGLGNGKKEAPGQGRRCLVAIGERDAIARFQIPAEPLAAPEEQVDQRLGAPVLGCSPGCVVWAQVGASPGISSTVLESRKGILNGRSSFPFVAPWLLYVVVPNPTSKP